MYIFGIATYIYTETIENVKHHDGGFLGAGYTTNDNRAVTVKDARMSLLWPILIMFCFIKALLYIFHGCFSFIPLLLGFDYKNTETYKYINEKLI